MMKNIFIYMLLVLFISGIFWNCSNQQDDNFENIKDTINKYEVLIEKFENNLLSFNQSLSKNYKIEHLSNRLDYSKNYQNTIYAIILNPKFDENSIEFNKNQNSKYTPNLFDKHLIENILINLTNDDVQTFFYRMEYYQKYIDDNIVDKNHKTYLTNNISEFKWLKYSIFKLKNIDNRTSNGFDSCFDACMEKKIKDELDDAVWIDWAAFLLDAPRQVAWWTASCVWRC